MKKIRNYFKRLVIRWMVEDYRQNGDIRQVITSDVAPSGERRV